MKEESTRDLLVIMSMKKDAPEEANQAFVEFHRRFLKNVKQMADILTCRQPFRNDPTAAWDILGDTFLAAYDHADSFSPRDSLEDDLAVRAWLFGIAKHQLLRRIDAITRNRIHLDYVEDLPDILADSIHLDEEPTKEISWKEGQLDYAMNTLLTEKERDVLLSWYEFSLDGNILPKDIRDSLCKLYSVKPDTLRQIKGRALKKLQNALIPKRTNTVVLRQ